MVIFKERVLLIGDRAYIDLSLNIVDRESKEIGYCQFLAYTIIRSSHQEGLTWYTVVWGMARSLIVFVEHFEKGDLVYIYIYIYIYIYYLRINMTRKSGEHLHATYGALSSFFNLQGTLGQSGRTIHHDLLIRHRLYGAWTSGPVVEFRFLHTVVFSSICSGGDYGVYCWWDLIRSKLLFSAPHLGVCRIFLSW